ncbi:hypothetical protein L198_05664 [Cryptococcus wingfieldii CBS 7118]|uniref:Uncharacterized protein n=1 Tax=Cryptococcus wingfieldii CBS 7118 TaxID=1295528 RepID=A0A1E3ITV1_9TREE|nr:hypothetical protein L198_05664 [Cryptococcus wingfieldii CBS 7118]ODN91992.1 hypothetical protein L198_05664 [Cryptococcus wingfieldii CBS 7118]
MSLRDSSCYTLTICPHSADPAVVELVESFGPTKGGEEPRYARVKEAQAGEGYSAALYDIVTGARLASAGYVVEKAKSRRLQLHGPDETIPFHFIGKINFEWTFVFQGNKYSWRRELYGKDYICTLNRKPDPSVEICLAREAYKRNPARLQILHYNIDRFTSDIKDVRGLETLLVTSLLCLLDAWEDRGSLTNAKSGPSPPIKESTPVDPALAKENPNEILVGTHTNMDDHVARAVNLLEDPNILFIIIRTKSSDAHQRALQVSLGVKRFRHRENMSDLHQYIIEEEDTAQPVSSSKGPKVIDLNDPKPVPRPTSSKVWTPPTRMAIYLSTIVLPDLNPSRMASTSKESAGNSRIQSNKMGEHAGRAPTKPPKPGHTLPGSTLKTPTPPPLTEADSGGSGSGSKSSLRNSTFGKLFR